MSDNKPFESHTQRVLKENDFRPEDSGIYNTKVREMENGDIAIPFACCFVMKRIENFDPVQCEVSVLMTMIMRVKMTNIE